MADRARSFRMRRPLAIALLVVAALMVILVGLALWNPWRLIALYPLAQQAIATGLLVLAGVLVASLALQRFAGNGRQAVFALIGCLVAVPALCVGLPVVALPNAFRVETTTVLSASPGGGFTIVKETSPDAVGVRLRVRSRDFLVSREARQPFAQCRFDVFEHGVPAEAVRFTSETTIAVPMPDQSTVVIRFDPTTLAPSRTVDLC